MLHRNVLSQGIPVLGKHPTKGTGEASMLYVVCLHVPHGINLSSILVTFKALPRLVTRLGLHGHHPL